MNKKDLKNTNIGRSLPRKGMSIKEGQDVTVYTLPEESVGLDNVGETDPDKPRGVSVPTSRPTGGIATKDNKVSIYGDIVPGNIIDESGIIGNVDMTPLKENEARLQEELSATPEERQKKYDARVAKHEKLKAKRRENAKKQEQDEREHYALSEAYKEFDPNTGQYTNKDTVDHLVSKLSLWSRFKLALKVIFGGKK